MPLCFIFSGNHSKGYAPSRVPSLLFPPRWHNSTRRGSRCTVLVPRHKRPASRRNSAKPPPPHQYLLYLVVLSTIYTRLERLTPLVVVRLAVKSCSSNSGITTWGNVSGLVICTWDPQAHPSHACAHLTLGVRARMQQLRLALIGEGSSVRALGQQVLVYVLEGSWSV